jgi:type I restriction enzyme M protein
VQLYGRLSDGGTSKSFDNADFGYTRFTIERLLCLRYQMTVQESACPTPHFANV